MLKITVMPPDGRSETYHFYDIEKAKNFLSRLVEQSGGAASAPQRVALDVYAAEAKADEEAGLSGQMPGKDK